MKGVDDAPVTVVCVDPACPVLPSFLSVTASDLDTTRVNVIVATCEGIAPVAVTPGLARAVELPTVGAVANVAPAIAEGSTAKAFIVISNEPYLTGVSFALRSVPDFPIATSRLEAFLVFPSA